MTSTDSAHTTTASNDQKSSGGLLRFVGVLGIIGGILMMVAGVTGWVAVSNQLSSEQITVAEDAAFLPGMPVADPFTAYAQADVIKQHALEASDGATYAELDREDPVRVTVMTASFLRASLFTSIVSFGVAAFAMGTGLLFVLFGWAVFALAPRTSRDTA